MAEPPPRLRLRDVRPSDPWETIDKGLCLVSPKVGILRDLGSGVHFPGDPSVHVVGSREGDPSRYAAVPPHESHSGSAGLTLEAALAGAIGEAVERYCMRFQLCDSFIFGSYRELVDRYDLVAPNLLRLHTAEQVESAAARHPRGSTRELMDEEAPVNWLWAYSLTADRPRLVPAHLVYLPYRAAHGERRVGIANSTGLAAGGSLEEAAISGLCEVIERDAFTICWQNRFVPRRIRVDEPDLNQLMEESFRSDHPRVDVRLFDLTLDHGVPTVLAWMRRPVESGPAMYLAASARLSPRAALLKTLVELAQCVPGCRFAQQQLAGWVPRDDFRDVTSFERHSVLYLKRPELMGEALGFLDDVPREIVSSDIGDPSTGTILGDLEKAVTLLSDHGYEVLVCDVTTEDVQSIGFRVVRVLVPGLVNLHGNHNWPFLAPRRLRQIPRKLRWEELGWSAGEALNPFPHPFP